jgi:peptidase E
MEKLDVSVIVPINSAKQIDFDDYFDRCIKSLKKQQLKINELLIVHTTEESIKNRISNYDIEELNVRLIKNEGLIPTFAQIK